MQNTDISCFVNGVDSNQLTSQGLKLHLNLEIRTCNPLICKMSNPRLIVSKLMEEFISIQKGKYLRRLNTYLGSVILQPYISHLDIGFKWPRLEVVYRAGVFDQLRVVRDKTMETLKVRTVTVS